MTSENSRMCATGCLNAKPDVLNCSCDLDFELWVFWLNLVSSWIVKIYAWSTIWNFFWPHIASTASDKSFKFKDVFAQFFPTSDYLFFWIRGYMTKPSKFVWFHFDCVSFFYTFENWIFIFFTNFYHKCSKNL